MSDAAVYGMMQFGDAPTQSWAAAIARLDTDEVPLDLIGVAATLKKALIHTRQFLLNRIDKVRQRLLFHLASLVEVTTVASCVMLGGSRLWSSACLTLAALH
jgi:hypothetical protein